MRGTSLVTKSYAGKTEFLTHRSISLLRCNLIASYLTMEIGLTPRHVSHHQLILPIDTVAVRPATRGRYGGTLSSLMRTGMRCARRTQLKVGLTKANSSLLVL